MWKCELIKCLIISHLFITLATSIRTTSRFWTRLRLPPSLSRQTQTIAYFLVPCIWNSVHFRLIVWTHVLFDTFYFLQFLISLPYYIIFLYLLQGLLSFPRLFQSSTLLLFSSLTIWGPEYVIKCVLHLLPQELQLRIHGSVSCLHLPYEPGLLWRSRPDTLQEWTNVRSSLTPFVLQSSHPHPPTRPHLWALLLPHRLPQNGPWTSNLALSPGLLAAQACTNAGHLL